MSLFSNLQNARIQKVSVREDNEVCLELFCQSEKLRLCLPPSGTARFGDPEQPPPKHPKGAQGLLRKRLARVTIDEIIEDRGLWFRFSSGDSLVYERIPGDVRLVFLQGDKVANVIGPLRPKDGRDIRRGQVYTPCPEGPLPSEKTVVLAEKKPPVYAKLKAERKRVRRLIKNLETDLRRHDDPEALAEAGEALKTVLHLVQRGMEEVVTESGVRIPLVAHLGGSANLERYFKRARRARRARQEVLPRLESAKARLLVLADAADKAAEEIEALLAERPGRGGGIRRRAAKSGRVPFRTFIGHGGAEIRVGKNAKDSDRLTLHIARGLDFWLHARDVSGAHVILRGRRNIEPPPALLDDAIQLALWFSRRRGDNGAVQIARKKYITKPGKGAPAGFVHVKNERVVHARYNAARTAELLATEVAATAGS